MYIYPKYDKRQPKNGYSRHYVTLQLM